MDTKRYRINGNEYEVAVSSVSGNHAEVVVNGVTYVVEMEEQSPSVVSPVKPKAPVSAPAAAPVPSPSKAVSGTGRPVASPLPGVIVAVRVNVGDKVSSGQVVAVLEAMKMENEILAESDGTVLSVNVSQGDSVLEGTAIVTIG